LAFGLVQTAEVVIIMSIINRYIARTVIVYILLALLLIIGVDLLFAFVRELKYTGNANYTVLDIIHYLILTIPRRIYNMFPMASLLGTVIGLGLLASHSELIIMRASGISFTQLAGSLVRVALILAVVNTAIGEWVVPKTQPAAEVLRAAARGKTQAMLTAEGAWIKNQNTFIHIDRMYPGGHMQGIIRYSFTPDGHLQSASYSRDAFYEGDSWTLHDTDYSIIDNNSVKTSHTKEEQWESNVSPNLLNVLISSPDDLSISGLVQYISYLKNNSLNAESYLLAFWRKIVQPFTTMVMIVLALTFIMSSVRNHAIGLRIVIGVVAGFAFYVLNQLFGPLSIVYNFPPLLAALMPTALFALLAAWLLRRVF